MSISADHEPLETAVTAQQIEDLTARLNELDTVTSGSAVALKTPLDFLNRSVELYAADSHHACLDTLLTGWNLVERLRAADPQAVEEDLVLSYVSSVIDAAWQTGDSSLRDVWLARRLALLEEMGRTEQAEFERPLGALLHHDVSREDLTALESAVAPVAAEDFSVPARLVLGAGLAQHGQHARAVEVLESVLDYLRRTGQEQAECTVLSLIEDSYVSLGDEETALRYIARVVELSQSRTAVGTVRMKRARLTMGSSSQLPAALYDLLGALELFTEAGIRPGAVPAALALGHLLQEIEEYDAAVAAFTVAVDHAERGESPHIATAMAGLGNALVQNEEPAKAIALLRRLLEMPEPASGAQAAERAAAYNTMAHGHLKLEENDKAAEAWTEAARRFLELGDAQAASAATANVAKLAYFSERWDEAILGIQAALGIAEEHGLHPLQGAEHLAFYATVLAKKRSAESLEVIEQALALAQHFEAPFHEAQYLETKALVLFELGRVDEAVAETLRTGDAYAAIGVPEEGARCDIRAGDLLRHRERLVEAVSVYRSALDRSPDRPDYMFAAFTGLATSLELLGQSGEAQAASKEAEAWAERARNAGHSLD